MYTNEEIAELIEAEKSRLGNEGFQFPFPEEHPRRWYPSGTDDTGGYPSISHKVDC